MMLQLSTRILATLVTTLALAACSGAPSPASKPMPMQAADDPAALIQAYAKLDLDPKAKRERPDVGFDDTSRERTDIEFRLVSLGKDALKPLTEALKSPNRHVRAMAVEILGVIGEPSAIPAIAEMAKDADAVVRMSSIQTLGWLKAPVDVIRQAEKDATEWVHFVAERALEEAAGDVNVKEAYAAIKRDELGKAEVGKPAPDFTLPTLDGKAWKLSDQKGVVVLMFQLADW